MQSKERSHDVLTRDVKKKAREIERDMYVYWKGWRDFSAGINVLFFSAAICRVADGRLVKKKKKGTESSAIALRRCWRSIDDARDARINIVYVSLGVERTSAY